MKSSTKLAQLAAIAVAASLVFSRGAEAQTPTSPADAMNGGVLLATPYVQEANYINAYGDVAAAGRATDQEQQVCQADLTDLSNFVTTHATTSLQEVGFSAEAVVVNAVVRDFEQIDFTPCPTPEAIARNGSAAFSPIDPVKARALTPDVQAEVAMISVEESVIAREKAKAAGVSVPSGILCQVDSPIMKPFADEVMREVTSPSGPRKTFKAMFAQFRPILDTVGLGICPGLGS